MTNKQIETIRAMVGVSLKRKKARTVAKIGFRNASDIPLDTSTCFNTKKSKKSPNPVDITPKNKTKGHSLKSITKISARSGVNSRITNTGRAAKKLDTPVNFKATFVVPLSLSWTLFPSTE